MNMGNKKILYSIARMRSDNGTIYLNIPSYMCHEYDLKAGDKWDMSMEYDGDKEEFIIVLKKR